MKHDIVYSCCDPCIHLMYLFIKDWIQFNFLYKSLNIVGILKNYILLHVCVVNLNKSMQH